MNQKVGIKNKTNTITVQCVPLKSTHFYSANAIWGIDYNENYYSMQLTEVCH